MELRHLTIYRAIGILCVTRACSIFEWEPGFKNAVIGLVQKVKTLQARIVSGSVILLSGSGLTTAVNLGFNG